MSLIEIALALAALYCGGMWLLYAVQTFRAMKATGEMPNVERETFHLGLCFILAAGFLGLLLK